MVGEFSVCHVVAVVGVFGVAGFPCDGRSKMGSVSVAMEAKSSNRG